MTKNYYDEINDALIRYEEHKSYKTKTMAWISDRISWCWKFRKITREQMEELADRATKIFEEGLA